MTFFFRHLTRSAAVNPRFPDDLADLLTRTQDDPVAAAAFEDAEVRAHLVSVLATLRHDGGFSQSAVAEAMEWAQPSVSELENGRLDPRVSTLQRFARAVGSRLEFSVGGLPLDSPDLAPGGMEADAITDLMMDLAENPVARASYEDAENRADLVAHLRQRRLALRMSQQRVAREAGLVQSVISELENGRTDPRLAVVQRYARATGGKVEVVLDGLAIEVEGPAAMAFLAAGRDLAAASVFEDVLRPLLRVDKSVDWNGLIHASRLPAAAAALAIENLARSGYVNLEWSPELPKPTRVQINSEAAKFIGISIRPDHVRGIRIDSMETSHGPVRRFALGDTSPTSVLNAVEGLIRDLTGRGKYGVTAVGVELAGPVHAVNGSVLFAPDLQPTTTASWANFPLETEIQERTGLLTVVSNDANALATYEHVRRGSEDGLIVVNLGESLYGIGAGLFFNGGLICGVDGQSGELGHVVVKPNGRLCERCDRDRRGCLETEASVQAVLTHLGIESLGELTDRAEGNDAAVKRGLTRAGRLLGQSLGHLSTVMNPKRVVIYGDPVVTEMGRASSRSYIAGCLAGFHQMNFAKVEEPDFAATHESTGPLSAAVTALNWVLSKPENWAGGPRKDPMSTAGSSPRTAIRRITHT